MPRNQSANRNHRVAVEALRRACDPDIFPFETSAGAPPLIDIIAQERAVEAIRFGLGIADPDFNIFVAGAPGTGKSFTIKSFVEGHAGKEAVPTDWCYIHDFDQPDRPCAVELPAGMGVQLEHDMRELLDLVREELPRVFEADDYVKRRDAILADLNTQRDAMVEKIEHDAREIGFVVERSETGLAPVPLKDDRAMTTEEFQALPAEEKNSLQEKQKDVQGMLESLLRAVGRMGREARRRLRELDRQVAYYATRHLFLDLIERYSSSAPLQRYLQQVQEDVVNRNTDFQRHAPHAGNHRRRRRSRYPNRYRVNVLVDHSQTRGAPVICESHPTYANLFGRVERRVRFGTLEADFTMIKPGAFHRANGGYLILNARDVLTKVLSWEGLKRALKDRQIKIEEIGEHVGYPTSTTVRPEPIPLRAKVILLGDPHLFQLLYHLDEDFRELFKVKAHFDSETDRSTPRILAYASLVRSRCEERGLLPFDRTGLARVVEFAGECVADQEKLSTQLNEIDDLLGEANHVARLHGASVVKRSDVSEAIALRHRRSSLVEEKLREMVARDILIISTRGAEVGQINGLTVYDFGDYAFGRPVRITASVSLGGRGIVDVERKAQLGGRLHTKGVMILAGFLRERYAQDKPLALSASLCFEQSYEGVEGDSASCAELYALLSALAGLPLKQSIAVTGSVNQKGVVQPIGGVNHKIEGFFDVCREEGLTGEQGVLIPRRNVKHLMLREDVVEAVREGRFHVYAVDDVDEGIEILTGVPAGTLLPGGGYTPESVNDRVDRRLREMVESLRAFRRRRPALSKKARTPPPSKSAQPGKKRR